MDRLIICALLLAFVLGCDGPDKDSKDTGARIDSGFFQLDGGTGHPDAEGLDAEPQDANEDSGTVDSGVGDAGTAEDAAAEDATPEDLGPIDTGRPDTGPLVQTGEVIINEVQAAGSSEWLELHNPSSSAVELTDLRIASLSSGLGAQPIYAASDPNGSSGTAATLSAGGYMMGVPNPSNPNNIPQEADFVFGAAGAYGASAFADTGDDLIVETATGGWADRVDFRTAVSSPATPLGPDDFPLVADVSTQLHLTEQDHLANDSGAAWCAPIFRGSTPGAANHDCHAFVISELTYDYAELGSDDDQGREFVEIGGAAGGSLTDVFLLKVEGDSSPGPVEGTFAISSGRMSTKGLYVVADLDGASTQITNADQNEDLDLENGPDAVQLIHFPSGGGPTLLDAVGYGNLPGGFADGTNGLPGYRGVALDNLSKTNFPLNWARDDTLTNSGNNATDFHYDPTATPGAKNGTTQLTVSALSPDNAVATVDITIVVRGDDFTDDMTVTVDSVALTCTLVEQQALSCPLPYSGAGTADRVDVVVATRPEHNATVTLTDGFTWHTANNELDLPEECDWCNLQWPHTATVAAGVAETVYARIYEAGATDVTTGGPAPGIIAALGYGPHHSDPRTGGDWVWRPGLFNVEVTSNPNNDEYQQDLVITTPGTYNYTFRFSLDGGLTWTYTDTDGAGSNTGLEFSANSLGVVVIN